MQYHKILIGKTNPDILLQISGFGQERKLSEYVHHYEPLTYDASGVHGQHHRHKRSLPEEDHKVSF